MPAWVIKRPVVEQEWTSELSVLRGHTTSFYAVTLSPTDDFVVSISHDSTARLWDYVTGTERFRFDGTYFCAGFLPDEKSVALGSVDGLISVHEFEKRSAIDLKGHGESISHVAFPPKSSKT